MFEKNHYYEIRMNDLLNMRMNDGIYQFDKPMVTKTNFISKVTGLVASEKMFNK